MSQKVGCWVVAFGGEKCDEMVEKRLVIYDQMDVRWFRLGGGGGVRGMMDGRRKVVDTWVRRLECRCSWRRKGEV